VHVVDDREAGGELQMGIDGALSESGSAVPATSGVVPGEVSMAVIASSAAPTRS
jgi:hypothetical protein